MTNIAGQRLANQQISTTKLATPAEIVARLGAMQAQDYSNGLWSVGVRLPGSTRADIERAVADRSIVRTWPMRGTLHFVAAADVRWIVKLLGPRVIAAAAGQRRNLEIGDDDLKRARTVLTAALEGGKELTRDQMYGVMDDAGITSSGQRGLHLMRHLSQEGLLCFGLHAAKQPTFVLLDEFVAPTPEKPRDEAVAELTRRYFVGHGPAGLADFVWWSGLTATDAKAGLAANADELACEVIDGKTYWTGREQPKLAPNAVYLLPGFDEYMLGYRDRTAALPVEHTSRIVPGGNGIFLPTIVASGQVVGTWKRIIKKAGVTIVPQYFDPKFAIDSDALAVAIQRYGEFIESPTSLG